MFHSVLTLNHHYSAVLGVFNHNICHTSCCQNVPFFLIVKLSTVYVRNLQESEGGKLGERFLLNICTVILPLFTACQISPRRERLYSDDIFSDSPHLRNVHLCTVQCVYSVGMKSKQLKVLPQVTHTINRRNLVFKGSLEDFSNLMFNE